MSIPVPAMIQAMIAPSTPVAEPKLLGSVKTPPPTMEPTTIPTSVRVETFCGVVLRSVDLIERLIAFGSAECMRTVIDQLP
jgi:hypothetical protein